MVIPPHVRECMEKLEQAGFAAYVVGGCVRDACLGLTPHDYDICTSALPEQTEAVFADRKLSLTGKQHGTIVVHTEEEALEITTFRAEGPYSDNRHPDWVKFVPEVEGDLARRDFTVNAIAYSPLRGFADPFSGREDLKMGILRAVGEPERRFREDALRILRGMRFGARFRLIVEEATMAAMVSLRDTLDNLARERVFEEVSKLLTHASAEDILRFAPMLQVLIPELAPMEGFCQHSPFHAYDLLTHTAHVVGGIASDPVRRWAALLHDVGKPATFYLDEEGRGRFPGHGALSAEMADTVLRRLKAPRELRESVVFLIGEHMRWLTPDRPKLRRQLAQWGWERTADLLALQWADAQGKGVEQITPFSQVDDLLTVLWEEKVCLSLKDLALKGQDLQALGYSGKEIGKALNGLLELVLSEQAENTPSALLEALKKIKEEQP